MKQDTYLLKLEELFRHQNIPITPELSDFIKNTLSEMLRQEETQIQKYISSLTIPALIINTQGIIVKMNTRFLESFGYKETEVAGNHLSNFIPLSQKEHFAEIMSELTQNYEIRETEIKFQRKDGLTATTAFSAFKLDPEDEYTIFLIRDLSLIRKLEKELSKGRVKLQKSEQFKAIFLSNMSHEIRTPMNAIIGFSELINMEGISSEKRKDYSKIINQRGQQLLALIDDIIEMTRIESGRITLDYTWIELDEFMNDLYSIIFQQKIREGKENVEVILQKQESASGFRMYTDPGRLHQIFINLLAYFVKNTSKGNISFGYTIENKEIEFFIHHSSIALNAEEQKFLFEDFWKVEDTTYTKIKGTGLSLPITKSLIELFGGRIHVSSDIQKGTSFIFRLPLVVPEKEEKQPDRNPLNAEQQIINDLQLKNWKNKVILIVEDDLVNYQFIEALLEKTQVQLLHAETGLQALDLCRNIHKIDLILMDIKLPEKNGYEITKEIKAFRKDIPIIAQTAFPLSEVRERCLESGCDDILTKPVDIEIFMAMLNKYLTQ